MNDAVTQSSADPTGADRSPTGSVARGAHGESAARPRSRRDAEATRTSLVRAARRRFAEDGYRATTVREIAGDAGVNVALISRYFGSKEGLFEACMRQTVEQLDSSDLPRSAGLDDAVTSLARRVARSPTGDDAQQLLLLLRSSGDEHADQIRRDTLHLYARRLAALAGGHPSVTDRSELVLRAQIAIASVLGVVLIRTSGLLDPLSKATEDDIVEPLSTMFRTLLA